MENWCNPKIRVITKIILKLNLLLLLLKLIHDVSCRIFYFASLNISFAIKGAHLLQLVFYFRCRCRQQMSQQTTVRLMFVCECIYCVKNKTLQQPTFVFSRYYNEANHHRFVWWAMQLIIEYFFEKKTSPLRFDIRYSLKSEFSQTRQILRIIHFQKFCGM